MSQKIQGEAIGDSALIHLEIDQSAVDVDLLRAVLLEGLE